MDVIRSFIVGAALVIGIFYFGLNSVFAGQTPKLQDNIDILALMTYGPTLCQIDTEADWNRYAAVTIQMHKISIEDLQTRITESQELIWKVMKLDPNFVSKLCVTLEEMVND